MCWTITLLHTFAVRTVEGVCSAAVGAGAKKAYKEKVS